MYDLYRDIIEAAEKALLSFDETKELLEYPEIQADKAYYLSILSEFNKLYAVKGALDRLKGALNAETEAAALLKEAIDEKEKDEILREISSLRRAQSECADRLTDALGRRHVRETVYMRFMFSPHSAKLGDKLVCAIKNYLRADGGIIYGEKIERSTDGYIKEASFFAEDEDIILRLSPLAGTHKVCAEGVKVGELKFAVSPAERASEISDDDLRVDLFHSSGAGGQNVNKVETAVRVTHIPTGISAVCQDERSQIKNRQRAIETIKKRVRDDFESAQKQRIEADIRAQYGQKNTPVCFDTTEMTIVDTRLKGKYSIDEIAAYINGIMTL